MEILDTINGVRDFAQSAFDDIINGFGKTCRIIYPPKLVDCNCDFSLGNKGPHGWSSGGPSAISSCTLCGGSGKRQESITEDIVCVLYWDLNAFTKIAGIDTRITQEGDIVEMKGFMTDAPKILRAKSVILPLLNNEALKTEFKLHSKPADLYNIVQGRYFNCYWIRAG